MILYGMGGHAKVVKSALLDLGADVIGYFDDEESKINENDLAVFRYNPELFPNDQLILTIGNNALRASVSKSVYHKIGKCISNRAIVDSKVRCGFGTVVLQGAIVQSDVVISNHCIINTGAQIDHDCFIADFVHIAPGAVLCGGVRVGEGALIGANATILPNLKIGAWAVVGAGSVVVNDVQSNSIVLGNPAKKLPYEKK